MTSSCTGTGRAARNWECFDAHRPPRSATSPTTRPCSCRAASRSGWPRSPTAGAPRVLIANSLPGTAVGNLGELLGARGGGADDVRPDDRGLVDLHRDAGNSPRAPTRPSPRSRAAALRRQPARAAGGHLGPRGMGGAQPLAVTMNEGVAPCASTSMPNMCDGVQETRYLDEVAVDLDDAVRRCDPGARAGTRALRGRSSPMPRKCCRRCSTSGFAVDVVTDQTSAHDPLIATCPRG